MRWRIKKNKKRRLHRRSPAASVQQLYISEILCNFGIRFRNTEEAHTKEKNVMADEMKDMISVDGSNGEVVLYTSEDGSVRLDVQIVAQTVWLSQQQMATLYGKAKSTICEHLTHIFEEGELDQTVVVRESRTTSPHGAIEGKTQDNLPRFYNLDAIIAVGFRVRSKQGTQFRQWAIERLKNYIVKGFDVDAERLKGNGGGQYWYELLNTIKDIRSSEKDFMGLTTFHGTHPTKADVVVAKNYLDETELRKLNNIVSGYFDFAENRALDHIPTTMHDYRVMLDSILSAGGNRVLTGAGSISAAEARTKALEEYRKFQVRTLSPVERDYLAALEAEAKKATVK